MGVARYPRIEIPAGTVFDSLTIISEIEKSGPHRRFLCRCACGKEKIAFMNNLRAGKTKSCGCTYVFGEVGRAKRAANYRARRQETESGRLCLSCDTWKAWSAFGIDRRGSGGGRASSCFECNNWRTVKAYFGITKAEYYWLHGEQSGVCVLCGEGEEGRRLAIDHDHSCCGPSRACKRCIRGLLCGSCNRMLGFVEKSASNRLRFADYLAQRPFLSVAAGDAAAVLEVVVREA